MSTLIPYLVFPGTCREAMEFYAIALKGDVTSIVTFGDSPIDVPSEVEDRIFDSEVVAGKVRIKASDDLPSHAVQAGSAISLFVALDTSEEQAELFQTLAEGGKILFPLEGQFGMLKDRYNIQWMLTLKPKTD